MARESRTGTCTDPVARRPAVEARAQGADAEGRQRGVRRGVGRAAGEAQGPGPGRGDRGRLSRAPTRRWTRRAAACHRVDAPRARGADRIEVLREWMRTGRSPRARGRRLSSAGNTRGIRTLPARAGQTSAAGEAAARRRDAPRARGADLSTPRTHRASAGRSPRARGRHAQEVPGDAQARTLPARAGQTGIRGTTVSMSRDAPRARGRHAQEVPGDAQAGTLPARAGQTVSNC